MPPPPSFDAFLSYSRTDKVFTAALARQLGRYTPPGSLGLPARRLQPFIDTSDLVGTDYFTAIQQALAASGKLVVICSPAARRSSYVQDEIRRFLQLPGRSAADLVPLLLAGTPNNEAVRPDQEPEKAFPDALYEALAMPLAVDYRGFDPARHKLDEGAYANAWFGLLANVLGVDRALLEEREARRRRQRRWVIGSVTGAVMAALAGLSAVALWQRAEALDQRQTAYARQLAAQAQLGLADAQAPAEAALERALAALQLQPPGASPEAVQAIGLGIGRLAPRHLARLALAEDEAPPRELAFSSDGERILGLDAAGVSVWRAADGQRLSRHRLPFAPVLAAVAPDTGAIWLADAQAGLWQLPEPAARPQLRHRLPAGETAVALVPGGAGAAGLLVTRRARDGGLTLRDLDSGALIRTLEARLGSVFLGWLPGPRLLHLAAADAAGAGVRSRLLSLDGQPLLHLGDALAADWRLDEMGQVGRQDPVVALAASADGQRIATARQDGRVSVWHPTERPRYGSWGAQPLPELESVAHLDHGDVFGAAAPGGADAPALVISPDGRWVASQSGGVQLNPVGGVEALAPLVRIWDVEQRREIARLRPQGPLLLRFSPQGARLLTLGAAAQGRGAQADVWQLAPQAGRPQPAVVERARLSPPPTVMADAVRQRGHARLSADGRHAVWLAPDLTLRLWRAGSPAVLTLDSLAPVLQQALQAQQVEQARQARQAGPAQRHGDGSGDDSSGGNGSETAPQPQGMPPAVPVETLFSRWREQQAAARAGGAGSGAAGASVPEPAAVAVPLAISPDGCCAVLALGNRLRFYDLAAGRLLRERVVPGRVPGPVPYGAVVTELLLSEGGRFVAFSGMERAQLEALVRDPARAAQPGQPWMIFSLHRSEDLRVLYTEPVGLAVAAPLPVLSLKPLALAPDGAGLTLARVEPAGGAGGWRLRVQAIRLAGPGAGEAAPPSRGSAPGVAGSVGVSGVSGVAGAAQAAGGRTLDLLVAPWSPSHPMDLAARLATLSASYSPDAAWLALRQTEPDCPASTATDAATLMPTRQPGCARVRIRYRSWPLAGDGPVMEPVELAEVLALPAASLPQPQEVTAEMAAAMASADPLALLPRLVMPGLMGAPVGEGSPFGLTAGPVLLTRHREAPAGGGTGAGPLVVRELRVDPQRLPGEACARLPAAMRSQAPAWAEQFTGVRIGPVCAWATPPQAAGPASR